MKRDNEMLRVKSSRNLDSTAAPKWPTHIPERTVVVGTNLLKHMDEDKLRNTKVTCLPGAKLRQVANVISTLPPDIEYDKMVVLAGGNDIADTDELHDTVDAYLTVVTEAKKQCANITISSVPPRLNNTNFTDKIKRFNAQLCQMAVDNNCRFINQHDGFHLASGHINDGYYDDDVHPNLKETNMMAVTFNFTCISPNSRHVATRDAAKNKNRPCIDGEESDLDQPFWRHAKSKASRARGTNAQKQKRRPTMRDSNSNSSNNNRDNNNNNVNNDNSIT